jgi:unsaturated rhamnogalacturonyl hydrolase
MKMRRTLIALAALLAVQSAYSQPEFSADSIKNMCKRVAGGRLTSRLANGWQLGTYFEGVMALYDLTQEKKYLDSTVAWGTYHNWLSSSNDSFPTNYDNVGCYQAYLETYLADPQAANLPHIRAALNYAKRYTYDTCPNRCNDATWPIVDQFHMAAPVHALAAQILLDPVMFDSVYKYSVSNARHHYNVKFHLFNSNCSDTNTTRLWWGRGCGWGVCGVCRILQFLPPDHPGRAWFEQKIVETSAKLLTLQDQTDGMWRSDLFQPSWNKEASGTAFFCYELFYGIRHGILDTATYLGPAKKAWKGLIGCVGVDSNRPNLPGWSQGVGGGPSNNFGPTNHDEYTEGAFLMAGNEFYQFVVNGITAVSPSAVSIGKTVAGRHGAMSLCAIPSNGMVRVPDGATSAQFFSPSGRILASCAVGEGRSNIAVPSTARGKGIVVVRFLFGR